jgi:hypothetical protein
VNQKTILILGAATVATVAATAALQAGRDRDSRPATLEERLLPGLVERVNDVRGILIETSNGPTTLRATDAGWVLSEAADYPANEEKIRTLLLDLRDARRLEAKTANADRHERLGLVAPDREGSSSVRVTLSDASGATVETVLIGNQRTSRAEPAAAQMGVTPDAQYYTLPGEGPQTFLAAGQLGVDSRTLGWVNQEFLNIDRSRLSAATITHPDGQEVVAVREDMGQNEMVVRNIPDGMVAKTPSGTAQLVGALQRLRFDDVRKADSLDWPEETISNATFTTEGGLQVSVETMKVPSSDDPETMVTWSRLAFDLAPEAEAEDAAPSTGEEPGAAEAQDEGPSRADLEAELAELRAATEGWAYALPTWKETSFRLRPEGVMEPAPEPEPEPEEGAAPLGATGSGTVDPVPLKLTPPPEGGGI